MLSLEEEFQLIHLSQVFSVEWWFQGMIINIMRRKNSIVKDFEKFGLKQINSFLYCKVFQSF